MTRKRLLQFVEYKNLTRQEFYDSVGFKRGILDADKRKSAVKDTDLAKILAIYPELDLYWLILGEGEMIRKINEPQETIEVGKEVQTPCDEIKIIAKERAYIIDLQKDKIEMQNKIIEDLELKLQKLKKEEKSIEKHSETPTLLEV